jgi:hypothetical protein
MASTLMARPIIIALIRIARRKFKPMPTTCVVDRTSACWQLSRQWHRPRAAKRAQKCPTRRIAQQLFGRESHRLTQFVARLNVVELRLKKLRLGVEFLSDSTIGLRAERLALLELLRGDPT